MHKKRIAAAVFLYFLDRNNALFINGCKRLADATLVALVILIAESRPDDLFSGYAVLSLFLGALLALILENLGLRSLLRPGKVSHDADEPARDQAEAAVIEGVGGIGRLMVMGIANHGGVCNHDGGNPQRVVIAVVAEE